MKIMIGSSISKALIVLFLSVAASFSFAANSADIVLAVAENNTAVITKGDLELEMSKMPPEIAASIWADATKVRILIGNLFVRRVLAERAKAKGLEKNSAVATKLRHAQERVLAEEIVREFDGEEPSNEILMKLARADYNSNPDRYRTFDTVTIAQILIGSYREDARRLAEKLRIELSMDPTKFPSLALMYSDDPKSKVEKGMMAPIDTARLRSEFRAEIDRLQPGDISNLIETELGWHIIRLVDRQAAGIKSFDEVAGELVSSVAKGVLEKRRGSAIESIQNGIIYEVEQIDTLIKENNKGLRRYP